MQEKNINRLKAISYIISIILFIIGFLPMFKEYSFFIYLISALLAGYDLLLKGIKNIFHLNFEEDTLMTIAIISAFAIGSYHESVAIALLFKLGEFIEDKAVQKTNKNINSIASIQVKNANLIKENDIVVVNAKDVLPNQVILIKPGEIVPVDCSVIKGESTIDTSSLTGETEAVTVGVGSEILSGSMNLSSFLTCRVLRKYENSAIAKIVDLVYEASNNKGKKEEYITKFSKIYTPTVIIISILLVIIPMIIGLDFVTWFKKALVFLVASCPCSIIISIPLAYFSCIGAISKKGLLIKGTKHIDALSKAKVVAFDKTGTITTGKMEIKEIVILDDNITKEEMLTDMYSLENNSNHPISTAILNYASKNNLDRKNVDNQKEIVGCGIIGNIENNELIIGNFKMLEKNNLDYKNMDIPENAVIFVKNKKIEGYIILEEKVREGVNDTIEKLRKIGIKQVVMLSGDSNKNAEKISKKIKELKYFSKLLPEDKVEKVNMLKKQGKVIFIGDGINDSPVLASADFGIAMGEGADIASNIADSILISNNISSLPDIIKIARKTIRVVNENIFISLFAKFLVLILGILEIAPIWLAVAADTGITLITVVNSIRIFKQKVSFKSKFHF